MNKIYILLIAALAAASSCTKNTRPTYDPDMHDVYYNDKIVTETRDSLFISLLTADEVSTHTVEIKLMGHALKAPAKFAVTVVPEKSTAVEGVHYQKFPEYFEFPAGEFSYDMPVTLIKKDPALENDQFVLTIRLVPTAELGVAYADRTDLRIQFSNMLRKPEGEGYYGDMTAFRNLFGEYSRVKHTMIIEMTGHDFWEDTYGSGSGTYGIYYESDYYTPYARKLYKMVTENEIYDENGKRITGWNVP